MDTLKKESEILATIKQIMLGEQQTVAVAESVTSGWLQVMFSDAIDASQFFHGGITTYNLGQKYRHLNVEPIHAAHCNCVSQKVAQTMAKEVCTLFRSDWGLGITGYASPVPESGNQVFAYAAIARHGHIVSEVRIEPEERDPVEVKREYALKLLTLFYNHLLRGVSA